MDAITRAVVHEQAGELATAMVGFENDAHLSHALALVAPERDGETAAPWVDLVENSAFLKGMYKEMVNKCNSVQPLSARNMVDASVQWNLNAKFRPTDRRFGIDANWEPLDPRINTIFGHKFRLVFESYPQYQSEQPIFPGNVVVLRDKNNDFDLFLVCWIGWLYDRVLLQWSVYSMFGFYLNKDEGRTDEILFPMTHNTEMSPRIVRIDEVGVVAIVTRTCLDGDDLLKLIADCPARDMFGDGEKVTARVVKKKEDKTSK